MRVAGRCDCGMVMEWVSRQPDKHMRCWGLRWCRRCGEVAQAGEVCRICRNARDRARHAIRMRSTYLRTLRRNNHTAYQRLRLADPHHRWVHNQRAKRWDAQQRRKNTAHYEKQKALKRVRYWAGKLASLLYGAAA